MTDPPAIEETEGTDPARQKALDLLAGDDPYVFLHASDLDPPGTGYHLTAETSLPNVATTAAFVRKALTALNGPPADSSTAQLVAALSAQAATPAQQLKAAHLIDDLEARLRWVAHLRGEALAGLKAAESRVEAAQRRARRLGLWYLACVTLVNAIWLIGLW